MDGGGVNLVFGGGGKTMSACPKEVEVNLSLKRICGGVNLVLGGLSIYTHLIHRGFQDMFKGGQAGPPCFEWILRTRQGSRSHMLVRLL